MNSDYLLTRRSLVKAGFAILACSTVPSFARAYAAKETRTLHFHNIHTGETLKTVYWEQGVYVTEALKDIAYILRDHYDNDMKTIDPHLLDVIAYLHTVLGSTKPFEVISGYRSPRTNAMLYRESRGVNPQSLHMSGKAIDIRLRDERLKAIRDKAVAMRQGGVGYYPHSDFVHVDTGPVKHWSFRD